MARSHEAHSSAFYLHFGPYITKTAVNAVVVQQSNFRYRGNDHGLENTICDAIC